MILTEGIDADVEASPKAGFRLDVVACGDQHRAERE
jgi:hypothetical protein